MYYVYVIVNEEGKPYIGFTSDLEKRLKRHNANGTESTKGHKWRYAYYEAFADSPAPIFYITRLEKQNKCVKNRCWGQLKSRIERSMGK